MSSGKYPRCCESYQKLCEWLATLLDRVRPRLIDLSLSASPILVFTDASWDGANAGWGVISLTTLELWQGATLHRNSLHIGYHKWVNKSYAKLNSMLLCWRGYTLEAGVKTDGHFLRQNRRSIFCVGNDASRLCLIKTVPGRHQCL